MDAIVLSGGSVKGSYQAGAIRAVLRSGFRPDIVTGVSVGALNAAYLAAFHPWDKTGIPPAVADWAALGDALAAFWLREVTSPAKVAKKRPWYELAYRLLFNKWAGVVDTSPLERLVRSTFADRFPLTGPLQCRVGAVNLRTGALEYHAPDSPTFLDAVLASTAEPVTMPLRRIGPDAYVDGGVREITPLAEAIRLGATRIVCIVCQPATVGEVTSRWGALLPLVGRQLTIVTNEIVANDLRVCRQVNRLVAAGAAPEKRHVEVTVIRPAAELPIALDAFGPADIARMVAAGDADARAVWPPRVAATMPEAA